MSLPRRVLVTTIASAALLAATGCARRAPDRDPVRLRGANVLLVTIDTLRRDRLGAYGNPNHLTPTLDRIAAEGIRYARAYSHVPMTLPAHTSILTGLTPAHHGVHNNVAFRLRDGTPTMATVLRAAGYRTGAFVGAFVLDARFGLSRGFDVYDEGSLHDTTRTSFEFAERRAADVLKPAGDWILSGDGQSATRDGRARPPAPNAQRPTPDDRPWFAWVHLFDPHAPYDAPAEYRPGRSPYDAEVAYTDAMLGAFLDRLRSAGALQRTLVVITADHGESLGDHGERTHGLFAYDSTLAVPLIVAGPGIPPSTENAPVGHVDLLPTIVDLVGVPVPAGLDGRSVAGAVPADRALYFEALDANLTRGWAPLTGVVRGPWKYIDLPIAELYDVPRDPREETNLASRNASQAGSLARVLREVAPTARPAADAVVDPEAAARLRSLGYVGGSAPTRSPQKARYTETDDPKRLVAISEAFDDALEAFNEGRAGAALDGFMAVLRQRADFVTARTSGATVLLAMGRPADAVALLKAAPREQAGSPELLAKLGAALSAAGDLPAAAAALERAQQAGDANPDLFNDRGVVYARMGRADDARRMFRALLDRDPDAAGTWYNLGMLELTTRNEQAAADALRRAVAANPSYGEAWQALGVALLPRDRAAAVDAWRRAAQLQPDDFDLLYNLAMVLADGPRPSDALPYLQRFAREAPRDRYARDIPVVNARIARLRR